MQAFVLMPFHSKYKWVYEKIIKPACSEMKIDVKRADDLYLQRSIMKDIVEGIIFSDVIIVDLSGRNPNVFYELGSAQSLLRPVILMTQDDPSTLPFDIRNHRIIHYSNDDQKVEVYKKILINTLAETIKIEIEQNNPIGDYMPISFLNRIVQANRHSKPIGELKFYKEKNLGLLVGSGKIERGLVNEPPYTIKKICWGSKESGWGWDGNDTVYTDNFKKDGNFEISGIPLTRYGEIRGTPYVRTHHNELNATSSCRTSVLWC